MERTNHGAASKVRLRSTCRPVVSSVTRTVTTSVPFPSHAPRSASRYSRAVRSEPTCRVRADVPGTVEGNPVFTYHEAFNPDAAEVEDLKARYRAGRVGDVEVKTKLANALNAHLDPIRERRAAVLSRPGYLKDVLVEGSKRARAVANITRSRARNDAMPAVPSVCAGASAGSHRVTAADTA